MDFMSERKLKEFYEAFDDKIVALDEKIIMKLHFIEVSGPSESEWIKAFYGEARVKSNVSVSRVCACLCACVCWRWRRSVCLGGCA